eukprot:TRINITY_DN44703_c0_g1_i1.p1 TRINITY_DN44703_c0_g1~~TRINITY_DN44703_c0_g1_i1.p1  ORF type:complete len:141 (+),score=6.07 TRINITY_DN44703_c0_g1_i1:243-665(+)
MSSSLTPHMGVHYFDQRQATAEQEIQSLYSTGLSLCWPICCRDLSDKELVNKRSWLPWKPRLPPRSIDTAEGQTKCVDNCVREVFRALLALQKQESDLTVRRVMRIQQNSGQFDMMTGAHPMQGLPGMPQPTPPTQPRSG